MILHKNKRPYLRILLAAIGTLVAVHGYGQVLYPDQPVNKQVIFAEEQYRQQHYALAAQAAREYLQAQKGEKVNTEKRAIAEKAEFILAVAALKMNEPGCTELAKHRLALTENKAYAQRINFELAQYYFLRNKTAEAIYFYERTGLDNLTNGEIADMKFELAYCYFNEKKFDKAEPLFASIKELKDGKYYMAGNYYYGLLAYNREKYKEALQSFERIRDNKDYQAVVPYYIAQIHYFTGNRADALKEALAIMAGRDKSYYDNDVHLLAAQCYFDEQKYVEAKPYFEHYYEHTNKIRKEDLYKIAYCYYRLGEWQNATEKFKDLSEAKDSLGQSSMYLLGDCYLKTGDRQSARNAFGLCAEMPYNPGQQEASMILYARISYDAGYNDQALRQLYALLRAFPSSQYKDEANTLLSALLIKTNNFADALKYLGQVSNKENNYWQVYQKAAYGFAVQQFRAGNQSDAYTYFGYVTGHQADAAYDAAAYFWRGELAYRLRKYGEAIANSQEYINSKADKTLVNKISPQATAQHAYVNMGFAAMENQNFSGAQTYFNKAQQAKGDDTYSGMVATLREADAVFMQQNFVKAITLYDKIITSDTLNADYARYQKSIILGLQGKNAEKIKVLTTLVNRPATSEYAVTAHYEMAVTYLEIDKYAQALPHLQYITDTAKDNSAGPKAWLKTGFIHQQLNDYEKAIAAYKHVVSEYPAADERMAALDALKSLYIQANQPSAYAQMLKDNNLPSDENGGVDSAYYAAAETQFASGKWDNAQKAFSSYLAQYNNGIFAIKAHYYRGESYYQLRRFPEALKDFDTVLTAQWNDFSENSARHAAAIAMESKDYAGAYSYYLKLRMNAGTNQQLQQAAFAGLVKSGYNAGLYAETEHYADTLLAVPGVSAELINEALLYKARSLHHFNKADSALSLFRQLTENKDGEIAAEARYNVAEILMQQDSLTMAEEAANETIRLSGGYDYWIVRSYILLSDIFVKQKDYFNAKATLTSIVKHTRNTELKAMATKKLAEVKVLEKNKSKLKDE